MELGGVFVNFFTRSGLQSERRFKSIATLPPVFPQWMYLDNDDAGNAATKAFLEHAGSDRLADMREHYADADDLNAWHLARRN